MKTVEQMQTLLEEVLADIYERPSMYGPALIEIESAICTILWCWAELTERRPELEEAKTQQTPIHCRSATGSFSRVFDVINPSGSDAERQAYVVEAWRQILKRLGLNASE